MAAADRAGCSDHPIVGRFEGSTLVACKTTQFDEYRLLVKPTPDRAEARKNDDNSVLLPGRYSFVHYLAPKDRSPLEIMSNVLAALKGAGAEVLFDCRGDACSPNGGRGLSEALSRTVQGVAGGADYTHEASDTRYAAVRLKRAGGDVHVAVLVMSGRLGYGPRVMYEVLESRPMQANMVTVDSAAMQRTLGAEGRQALYGIGFDTNAATLKPESQPQLDEIVRLLKAQPLLALYVVGHTDNVGALDANLDLSLRRAQAVVTSLVKAGIATPRLTPRGVAQLAPLAPNTSEEGRAKNRRVEVVVR